MRATRLEAAGVVGAGACSGFGDSMRALLFVSGWTHATSRGGLGPEGWGNRYNYVAPITVWRARWRPRPVRGFLGRMTARPHAKEPHSHGC